MEDVRADLLTVLDERFDVDSADVAPDRTLTDLGFDSISAAELVETLSERWEVELVVGDRIEEWTVDQLERAVQDQLADA